MSVSRPATARELGAQLRAHRKAADLSLRALEKLVGMSNAKISLWENGHRLPSLDDLDQVLDALNVTGDERERLIGMRREAEGPGQLVAGAPTIGAQLAKLIEQEQVARRITEIAPLLVPGLLQTADYARAILSGHPDTDTRVALRMGRREILTRSRSPVEFHALIDDEVLGRSIAPPTVMVEQLRHLLKMADLSNITIQLVRSTHAGYTPMLAGPFILLEFETASPIVHLEHHRASASLWDEGDVRSFKDAVEQITNAAMTPERTTEIIKELVSGMEKKK
jgi:transcriptional regulator with XRE-family HTH domain